MVWRLPAAMTDQIRACLAGEVTPPEPRLAATVLLVRDRPDAADGAGGTEVVLLRRARTMSFAAGAEAFPGGRVDPADAEPLPWTGTTPEWVAERIAMPVETARSLVHAAVRELFEEAGVLLAAPVGDGPVPAPEALTAERTELLARRTTLAEIVARHGLVVRADLLRPWARWITPVFEKRRYDTWFFVAPAPEDAVVAETSVEAALLRWYPVGEAARAARARELPMMPPTMTSLGEIAEYGSVAELIEAADHGSLRTVRPFAVPEPDGSYRLVWETEKGLVDPA